MPRKKLSEYRAKCLVAATLDIPYVGWSVTSDETTAQIKGYKKYVVKVDQAVKGRFKKGLVILDVTKKDLSAAINTLKKKGYSSFLIEPYLSHEQDDERYLSFSYDRSGYRFMYSRKGGVNIEQNTDSIESIAIGDGFDWQTVAEATALSPDRLARLYELFKHNFMTLLEINPYTVQGDSVAILDTAIEVDDTGEYFVDGWSEADIRSPRAAAVAPEETVVRKLDANSPASFNLSILNQNGSVFLLLSGGGASVVIADEVNNVGLGRELANYGEYSGNPNIEETYLYTSQVMQLILKSNAKKKILFVGGAVANFTDIANTFAGVIRAVDEHGAALKKQGVKIFVRRGGPRQEVGLAKIKTALEQHGLLGGVYTPATSIPDALHEALKGFVK